MIFIDGGQNPLLISYLLAGKCYMFLAAGQCIRTLQSIENSLKKGSLGYSNSSKKQRLNITQNTNKQNPMQTECWNRISSFITDSPKVHYQDHKLAFFIAGDMLTEVLFVSVSPLHARRVQEEQFLLM